MLNVYPLKRPFRHYIRNSLIKLKGWIAEKPSQNPISYLNVCLYTFAQRKHVYVDNFTEVNDSIHLCMKGVSVCFIEGNELIK